MDNYITNIKSQLRSRLQQVRDSEEIKNPSLRKYLVKANKDHVAHLTLVLKSILSREDFIEYMAVADSQKP